MPSLSAVLTSDGHTSQAQIVKLAVEFPNITRQICHASIALNISTKVFYLFNPKGVPHSSVTCWPVEYISKYEKVKKTEIQSIKCQN